jgi:AcrR family transcriptional regulator
VNINLQDGPAPRRPAAEEPELTPRQLEILERTLEVVQETGLANLTLKRVADRVGFTEAAIYRHFDGKRALLLGLIALMARRLLGRMREIAAEASSPPAVRLERMVRHHVELLLATRGLPLLLIAEGAASGDREIVERFGRVMDEYRDLLAALLEDLQLPLSGPVREQTVLFLGLPAAVGILMRVHPDFSPGPAAVEALVHYYVGALVAPAVAESRP